MVSTGYVPIIPSRVGAVEPYIYDLSKNLSLAHDVHVFGTGQGAEEKGNLHVQAFNYKETLPYMLERPLGHRLAFQIPFNICLFKKFCDLNKKQHVDVLHIHDANSGFAAGAIGKTFHTPWVCSIHNEIRSTASIQNCNKVLAVSNYIKNFLTKQRRLNENKVEVLNMAIDPNLYKRNKKIEQAKETLKLSSYNIILFVGRKCPEKGPQILINALPKIIESNPRALGVFVGPDYTFGSNYESYTNILEIRAKELGIEKHTSFYSFVSQSLLERFYEAADVVVFPSIWQEPFGKVILEAMSYEIPVIASNVGGVPEIVINDLNGLMVPPGDSNVLAKSVNYLLRNPESAKNMGAEGKKTVLDKYTFEQIGKQCNQIYNEIA
jgi:glycosyltransferase involved in cell wall biosynthesis